MTTQKNHIVIAGGTGFIGSSLARDLDSHNITVSVISRTPKKHKSSNNISYISHIKECAAQPTHFINLAGAGIADRRWTFARKTLLLSSRCEAITEASSWLAQQNITLKAALCGSAIGFYGFNTSKDKAFVESDAPNNTDHFSHLLCKQVEESAQQLLSVSERLCILRTGVVIGSSHNDNNGGALQKMRLPASFCLNGVIGNGQQSISWIHMTDMVNAIKHMLSNENASGIYNLTSPAHCSNKQLSQAIGKALSRPLQLPVPTFILKLMLGDAADLLIKGQSVNPKRLLEEGFVFEFNDIDKAVAASI